MLAESPPDEAVVCVDVATNGGVVDAHGKVEGRQARKRGLRNRLKDGALRSRAAGQDHDRLFWAGVPRQRAHTGQGVKLIGRWHNTAELTGVAILEATDTAPIYRHLCRWTPVMDVDISPVLDDEESAAVAKQVIADLSAG